MTEIIPETLGCCIDRQDKNGKWIFEGDILKGKVHLYGGYRVRNGVVTYVYYDNAFKLRVGRDDKEIPYLCEIIGNVYDNPYLLEESK
jgi:uncharacterized phage protein (TIGR01671 family)